MADVAPFPAIAMSERLDPAQTATRVPDSQFSDPESDMVGQHGAAQTAGGDNRKLTREHFPMILNWLEVPDNFARLNGSSRRLAVGVRHPPKKTVFRIMLIELHQAGFPAFVATGDNLGKRFQRYVAKYKEALAMKQDSGAGLTMDEIRRGITIDGKLEKCCPHFHRMHTLYGERANVAPPSTGSLGLPGVPEIYVHAGSDDDELQECDGPGEPFDDQPMGIESDVEFAQTFSDDPDEPPIPAPECSFATEEVAPSAAHPPRPTTPEEAQTTRPVGQPTVSHSTSSQTRRAARRKSREQAPTKPTLAEVYAEKLAEKAAFRLQMIAAKEKWRAQELADRKEARESSSFETFKRDKILALQALKRDRMQREFEEKRAEKAHRHAMELVIEQQHSAIVTEIFRSTKTPQELRGLMEILPHRRFGSQDT